MLRVAWLGRLPTTYVVGTAGHPSIHCTGHGMGGQSIVRSSDVICCNVMIRVWDVIGYEICFAHGPMHGHDGGASS